MPRPYYEEINPEEEFGRPDVLGNRARAQAIKSRSLADMEPELLQEALQPQEVPDADGGLGAPEQYERRASELRERSREAIEPKLGWGDLIGVLFGGRNYLGMRYNRAGAMAKALQDDALSAQQR